MKEAIYSWVKCIAVFYIFLTMLLHLVPTEKYQRYIRFFMGLLLIVMVISPVLSLLEKSRGLSVDFGKLYEQEEKKRLQLEMENLQKNWLEKGCEEQLGENIAESLKNNGIEVAGCEVHIEGELLKAVVWVKEVPDEELEGGIKDALGKEWGIRVENCEILPWTDGEQTVGDSSFTGPFAVCDRTSGIWQKGRTGNGYYLFR